MRLYVEFDINNFEAWSGAVDTKNRIIEEGKTDLFNAIVEDICPRWMHRNRNERLFVV